MKDWLASFPLKKFSIFAVLIVAFIYNVLFEGDVPCTCKNVGLDCTLYVVLPCLIIFALMIWTDETCFKVCRLQCTCRCPRTNNPETSLISNPGQNKVPKYLCCEPCLYSFFKALLVSLLWFLSVLIDGDWFVCCLNDGSDKQSQLACKEKNNITAGEKVTITQLKNKSRYMGFGGVLGILVVLVIIKAFDWKKCCSKCWEYDRTRIYYKMVFEENEEVLENELREAAKRDLTERIQNKIQQNWMESFEVAEEMIREGCRPAIKAATGPATRARCLTH